MAYLVTAPPARYSDRIPNVEGVVRRINRALSQGGVARGELRATVQGSWVRLVGSHLRDRSDSACLFTTRSRQGVAEQPWVIVSADLAELCIDELVRRGRQYPASAFR